MASIGGIESHPGLDTHWLLSCLSLRFVRCCVIYIVKLGHPCILFFPHGGEACFYPGVRGPVLCGTLIMFFLDGFTSNCGPTEYTTVAQCRGAALPDGPIPPPCFFPFLFSTRTYRWTLLLSSTLPSLPFSVSHIALGTAPSPGERRRGGNDHG